ncbi:hypothetical protein [Reyranella sp.]|uniref:hypothetical protein n=1 Tax=Reyranella sp. TaxID=1929291 RepID=UPI003D0B9470
MMMRISRWAVVVVFAAAQLAGVQAAAQLMAAASTPMDCSPDAPDSLEISWTQPCNEGDWLLDTEVGCRMGDWHPDPNDRAVWSGACPGGNKDGQGVVQWYEHGQMIDRFEGTFRNGKREGFGRYVWAPQVSYEGLYGNDVPNGPGTATVLGETFSGTWRNGCLEKTGRVVAIGVERSSCSGSAQGERKATIQR